MKKIILSFILLIAVVNNFFGQITTSPEFPVATQSVTIYFDATGTGLDGYSGDVYAHTGVILEGSSSWSHVIGSWGDNTTQPKLTHISGNQYSLDITPTINDYYGISAGETVVKLAFVFRSADASQQTSDLFVDVYSQNDTVTIASPDTSQIYEIGDSVTVSVVAMFADSIKLFVEDTLFNSIDSSVLTVKIPATKQGKTYFSAIAFNTTDTAETQSYFFVRKNTEIAELPTGVGTGITYLSDSSAILCLYAPGKNFIYVKGDFNNWQLSNDYLMNMTADSSYFWLEIDSLTPSEQYAYQYFVDGDFYVADPYCEEILDPWNDQYIPSSTYPNLKPYPTGKAEGIVSVLQTAAPQYSWKIENFIRPEPQNLVIYELLVRDFSSDENFQAVIDSLDYLKNLGINAIEFMPVSEFEGNISWGYNPDFYFAVDKYYGTKNKFKELIDSCHSKGIAVIMDIVLNHSMGQSPLVQLYMNRDTWQVTPDNPWYNVSSPNPDYSWGYDFNHESQATRDFVDKVLHFWLSEYKIDGYRFDFSKGFTNTPGDGWNYDQTRIDILKHYADTIWATSPNAYLILEHFTDNSEEKVLSNYGMLLWGNSNYNYAQASMGYSDGSDFSWISYKNRGWTNPNVVGYMESHDEERMMYRNLNWGRTYGDYDIKDLTTALDRVKLASVFFLTVPGPKMLWQFEELGYDYSINYCQNGNIDDNCRTDPKPVRWDYFSDTDRKQLYYFLQNLIQLKKNLSTFQTYDFTINASDFVKTIILNSDTSMVIVGNFDVTSHSKTITFPHNGTWYEYYTGQEFTGSSKNISLDAGEYLIFTDAKLPSPEIPAAPEAHNVEISGNPQILDTLTLSFTYFDPNNDPEGDTKIQWYRCLNNAGAQRQTIAGATDSIYIITENDLDKYIQASVTPVAVSDAFAEGNTIYSNLLGPVTYSTETTCVFPNPTTGNISFINIKDYDEITVTDLQGHLIDRFDVNDKNIITKDYSSLQAGLYLVLIKADTKIYKTKFLKTIR